MTHMTAFEELNDSYMFEIAHRCFTMFETKGVTMSPLRPSNELRETLDARSRTELDKRYLRTVEIPAHEYVRDRAESIIGEHGIPVEIHGSAPKDTMETAWYQLPDPAANDRSVYYMLTKNFWLDKNESIQYGVDMYSIVIRMTVPHPTLQGETISTTETSALINKGVEYRRNQASLTGKGVAVPPFTDSLLLAVSSESRDFHDILETLAFIEEQAATQTNGTIEI